MKKTSLFSLFLILSGYVSAQTVVLEDFSLGYNWLVDIAHTSDDNLYILQQDGYIYRCNSAGVKQLPAFLDISNIITPNGEKGLLGMTFHPQYASNGYFYVNYTAETNGQTRVVRYTRSTSNPEVADPTTAKLIIAISQPYGNHNGGCIKFGPDGYLYIGMGDGGAANDPQGNGQNPGTLLAKMLRLDVDVADDTEPYEIPADNPFAESLDTLPEIWSLGWRNPWRFSYDRLTNDMWAGDVGQNAWEEVHMEPAGAPGGLNYGWRCYEGNAPFNTSGCGNASDYESPVFVYPHPGSCSSITGGYVYRGAKYNSLFGKYLVADYCDGRMWAVWPNGNGGWQNTVVGTFTPFAITSFGEDIYGELYLTDISIANKVSRITVPDDAPVAHIIGAGDTLKICQGELQQPLSLSALYHPSLTYQWLYEGNPIEGQTSADMLLVGPSQGNYSVEVTNEDNVSTTSAPTYYKIYSLPPVVEVTGEAAPCKLNQATYSTDMVPDAEFVWTVTGGTIISGQGTNTLTVEWGEAGPGQISVTLNFY